MPHLLKRLELNGFKSFAQKTVFEFPSGITAIVGPNGSGKSNIIDAIRWILGEREAKNLRGGKAEDLIFAGTAKRPRLGQAQASLYFENKDKFFSVDFSEVSISREVRRDGANRYFLNKSEVRLKDLVDFFARARLGSRGLVVMTQGNSDIFIRATSSERREMIEEMLGLREYQLKRAEAERRLKHAQINLDKVKALTEEILPHLRSLKRQTNKWEKRESLETELRDLENRLFGFELHELSVKIAKTEGEIAAHGAELTALQREKEAAEKHMKQVEADQPKERRELTEVKRRLQQLILKRSELQKELGRLEAKLEMGERSSGASLPQAATLAELIRTIKKKLETLIDADYDDMCAAIQEIMEDIDGVLIESPQASSPTPPAFSHLQSQFEKIKQDIAVMEEDRAGLEEEERSLEKGQERFYKAFKETVAAVEAAKDRIEHWENRNRERLFEKERLKLRRAEWERQVRQAGRAPEEFVNVPIPEKPTQDELGAIEKRIFKLRGDLASIGDIDEALLTEARETEERYRFLGRESEDLEKAKADLKKLVGDLGEKIESEFSGTLTKINEEFNAFFSVMFGGGRARLRAERKKKRQEEAAGEMPEAGASVEIKDAVKVEDREEEIEEGIEIDLKLPRKRITSLDMLSGGERSLVGIAALFALISVSPPPFLVLDEVDAMLDERNARRFSEMLKEFSKKTQFVIVTHNRATMEAADILYGITLSDDETSKAVSLKLANSQ